MKEDRFEKPRPREAQSIPPKEAASAPERGRHAESPKDVPKRGWVDILWRTKQQLAEDNLTIVAAGVAFYAFVAVVPGLAAVIASYALFADAAVIAGHLGTLSQIMPGEVMPMLREQITRIAGDDRAAGISAVVGVALALYSSAKATKALIVGLNIAYDESERRNFFKLNLVALAITLGGILALIAIISTIAVVPALLETMGLTEGSELVLSILRWPVLIAIFMSGLAVIYRVGPCRDAPQWRWVTWGAALASFLWVLGSVLFSVYASQFGNYEKTYGSLGAIVVFLLWLFLSAFVVLFGAELNSEMERQTVKDTTKGKPKPMGKRDAYAADTVGPSKPARHSKAKKEHPPAKAQDLST